MLRHGWEELFRDYGARYPDLAEQLQQMQEGGLPDGWDADIPGFAADPKGLSSREASGKVLTAPAPKIHWLLAGAAALGPPTKTRLHFDDARDLEAASSGTRNPHFRIR